jgi:glycosyltransferase involved in cell wall biosynthesis
MLPRILFVEAFSGAGGSGSSLLYMLQHLDRERFDVLVASYLKAESHHIILIKEMGISFIPLSNRRQSFNTGSLSFVKNCRSRHLRKLLVAGAWLYKTLAVDLPLVIRLVRLLRSEQVSIAVLHNDLHYHTAGVVAARLARVPCIVRKAGGIGEGYRIKRVLTRWVDAVVAISAATRDDQLLIPTRRVVLIHEGVDLTRFDAAADREEARAKLDLPCGKQVVGCAARLVEGKGQKELIQAAAKVVREYPDVVFYIAGSHDPVDEGGSSVLVDLQNLARELGVSDQVIFGGWHNDMPAVLAAFDIFVHCPTTFIEGLGVANLEAMACGKPTIGSENGGLPDAIVDGVTGFIVPPGDIDALAQAILRLLRDPELARRLGRAARKRIEEKFEIGAIMRDYEQLFAEYVSPGSQRRPAGPNAREELGRDSGSDHAPLEAKEI